MTIEEKLFELLAEPRWQWAAAWFRLGEVIVQAPGRAYATKKPCTDECPADVLALGSSGVTQVSGQYDWIGWDLDVGHGKASYSNTFVAIQAARKIKSKTGANTEIRLSKSGQGVHVRALFKSQVPLARGPQVAKEIVHELGIRTDPTALSRQAFWLWCANPGKDAFKRIEKAAFDY